MNENPSMLSAILISWLPMLIILGVFWLVPLFIIGKSNKVGRNEKLAWLFATLFCKLGKFHILLTFGTTKTKRQVECLITKRLSRNPLRGLLGQKHNAASPFSHCAFAP